MGGWVSPTGTMDGLRGKSLVIVGGSTGMGLSAARACIGAGARVVVSGRTQASLDAAVRELGDSAVAIRADASDLSSAAGVIAVCRERFGGFDGLYHVAGGSGRKLGDGPLHAITDEGWEATMRLNLTSAFGSARAACQALLEQGRPGSIVLMGSVLGLSPSPAFFATHAYAAAKSAVVGFVRSCAASYASRGIRFNVIAPALVDTPMATRAVTDELIQAFIRTKQPLDGGRVGRPEDLDAAVVFLLSEDARFVTGQTLVVDGGWSVSEGQITAA